MSRIRLFFDDTCNRPVDGSAEALESAVGLAAADFYDANTGSQVSPDMLLTVALTHLLGVGLFIAKRSGCGAQEFPDLVRDIAAIVVGQTGQDAPTASGAIMGVAIGHA